jgi:LysM repeat protein
MPTSPERLIPFPTTARSTNPEPEPVPRRRQGRDLDRASSRPRRARRRRQETPWVQRNALSVAAISMLVALLGLGFGLLQMINRPEPAPAPALLALGTAEAPAAVSSTLNASISGPDVVGGELALTAATAVDRPRQIQATVRTIEPNYTVAAGDTLGQIATRFNTTVERIQALNDLADPRALRIGTRLVIPPTL